MENSQNDRFVTAQIKVYYDLFVPENSTKPAPLLIAVHGYGGNKRAMMREARACAPDNFAVVSLQGFHQHWRDTEARTQQAAKVGFAWLTHYKAEESVAVHHQALRDLIADLTVEKIADANEIHLLGFSQSCALNFRFAFTNPDLLKSVTGISGGIPGDWQTSEFYQEFSGTVSYLYGDTDEFYPLEKFDENAEKLKSRAPHLRTKKYAAAHEISDEMKNDVKLMLAEM